MLFGLPYYLILVIPLAGSLVVPLAGRFNERLRDWTPVILMGVTMVFCWSLFPDIGNPQGPASWPWIEALGLRFEVLLDPLSVIMAVLSSSLCFLIYVYSTEYMAHEGDRDRFFFLMLAFGGGMLTLVLSNNLLIAFIGWEIMGFCSYGLIGFWNDRKNAPEIDPTGIEPKNRLLHFKTEGEYNTHCGTKAFIVTRVGDAFMLGGILLLFMFTGTFSFTEMAVDAQNWWQVLSSVGLLLPIFLLIFAGAIGKSGQAPLDVWLPEAMAGPTSVSALIHAATMVNAGVYITARFLITMLSAADHYTYFPMGPPPFASATSFFTIVAIIGAVTAFMTATMGMVSNELKQILAFSTLSQLGYMMLAIGTGGLIFNYQEAYMSGVLHIISHGAFKALLFLAAGGVIHVVHTKYLSKMGGLKQYMPKTFLLMWIGVLALSGIPPFSGFWSKDSIIEYTYELALHNQVGMFLFVLSVLAAACTIFYSIRLMGMAFYGPSHGAASDADSISEPDHEAQEGSEPKESGDHEEPHDPGPAMMVPLYILAAFTIVAFAIFPFIQGILFSESPLTLDTWAMSLVGMVLAKVTMPGLIPLIFTLGALALGGIPAYVLYIRRSDRPNTAIPEQGVRKRLYGFLKHRWYINEFYYWLVGGVLRFTSSWKTKVDDRIIDGIDFGSAHAATSASKRIRWFDDHVVDGFAEEISTASVAASESSEAIETGRVNDYVAVLIFGVGLLVILALISMGVI
jgi:NADH-quinone oxidoreductase subunit L